MIRPPDRATLRELIALAWPIATAMGGETLMGLVDTKLVGGLGASALGGVGVAMTVAWLGYMCVFGLMRGVKVCVAHAVGEGRPHLGVRYAQAGITIGIGAGVFFWAITRETAPLFRFLQIDPILIPPAVAFLQTFTYGAPATAVLSALGHYRQATGDSRTPMIVGLAGNVFNAVLGFCLIYGHGGLPALGVRGCATASAISEALEAAALAAVLIHDVRRSGVYERARASLPLSSAIREFAAVGIPTSIQFGSEMLAMVAFTATLGGLGPEQIAAHQIALATIRASFLPGAAVSEAASVLVGQALGRRSVAGADRVAKAALVVAVAFMASCGVVFALASGHIASAFTNDGVVATIAQKLLWIAAAFQVLDAVAIVLRGALRGAKDVRIPAAIGVTVIWTCVPTAAVVLGRGFGWGAAGGWFGFLGETTIGAALFAWRWRRGAWRRTYGDVARDASAETRARTGPTQAPLRVT